MKLSTTPENFIRTLTCYRNFMKVYKQAVNFNMYDYVSVDAMLSSIDNLLEKLGQEEYFQPLYSTLYNACFRSVDDKALKQVFSDIRQYLEGAIE